MDELLAWIDCQPHRQFQVNFNGAFAPEPYVVTVWNQSPGFPLVKGTAGGARLTFVAVAAILDFRKNQEG